MTTSAGSSIAVRDDRHPFNAAEVGVGTVGDVSRTGSVATRMSDRRAADWSSGHSASDRRRSFAAMSSSRLSNSPPTLKDIEVEIFDDDDYNDDDDDDGGDDDDDEEEKNIDVRLLSKNIEEILRGDDLYLDEPVPLSTMTTKDDCSPLEELDRVTTLQSFSPADDWRRRHRMTSASRHSPLYRCYSTDVDRSSPSRFSRQLPQRRRITWCSSFDATSGVEPAAVERCSQHNHLLPGVEHLITESMKSSTNHDVGDAAAASADEGQPSTATLYLRDQLRALFQVADNRLAMKLFGSHNALLKEKRRQKAVGNFVIHPCSSFRYQTSLSST